MTNYKTKKKNGKWKAIGAVVLSVVLLAGGCVVGYGAGTNWTYKRGVQVEIPVDGGTSEINNTQNVMQLSGDENRGVTSQMRALKKAEYQEYEIDAQSVESAHVATVTLVNHDEATDKSITLSAAFTDSYAIKNFNPSDFISFSSTTVQSGEQFTISCLQAFSYPITIKATANGSVSANDGSKAYCTIKADYVRRYTGIYFYVLNELDDEIWWRLSTEGETKEMELDVFYHPNKIVIETSVDDSADWSEGTMLEDVTNVRIAWSDGHPVQEWEDGSAPEYLTGGGDPNYTYCDNTLFYTSNEQIDIYKVISQFNADCKYFAGGTYAKILDNYNKKITTSRLWVQFTGEITGITYTFYTDLIVNPKYMYVPATGPSFDPDTSGGIIF